MILRPEGSQENSGVLGLATGRQDCLWKTGLSAWPGLIRKS